MNSFFFVVLKELCFHKGHAVYHNEAKWRPSFLETLFRISNVMFCQHRKNCYRKHCRVFCRYVTAICLQCLWHQQRQGGENNNVIPGLLLEGWGDTEHGEQQHGKCASAKHRSCTNLGAQPTSGRTSAGYGSMPGPRGLTEHGEIWPHADIGEDNLWGYPCPSAVSADSRTPTTAPYLVPYPVKLSLSQR